MLRQIVDALPKTEDERLICGPQHAEDAAVYRLSDADAIITTIDVITPVVDDPEAYGAIAAANALSDVYAMGGLGLMAIAYLAAPKEVPLEALQGILRGAGMTCAQDQTPLVGGHSVQAPELAFGLAVTGRVDPERVMTNAGLKPGDALLLTKPLGTGALLTALRRDLVSQSEVQRMLSSAAQTNRAAVPVLRRFGAHAVTDVTGFGLLGHTAEMAAASGVEIHIDRAKLPAYPLARYWLEHGCTTRANATNEAYARSLCSIRSPEDPLLYDPQTSGGLLIGLPAAGTDDALVELQRLGYAQACCIGHVTAGDGVQIV